MSDEQTFDFLVGRWQARGRAMGPEGRWEPVDMVWMSHAILDGHAIAGTYQTRGADHELRVTALDFRRYDPKAGRWIIEWLDPGSGQLRTQVGGRDGEVRRSGNAVSMTSRSSGFLHRERFQDIAPDRFVYRAEISRDEGDSWTLIEDTELIREGDPAHA